MTGWQSVPTEGLSRQAQMAEKIASLEKLEALLAQLSKARPAVCASQEVSAGGASAAEAHEAMITAVQRAWLLTEAALAELLEH